MTSKIGDFNICNKQLGTLKVDRLKSNLIDLEKINVENYNNVTELIAGVANKLNEIVEVVNSLKNSNEVLKNKLEIKLDRKDIAKAIAKIKKKEGIENGRIK